jgi:hypothetical protein
VLDEKLRREWQARRRVVPISPVLQFTPDGLVLGAGTIVVAADGQRRLSNFSVQKARILALLSAAYGTAIPPKDSAISIGPFDAGAKVAIAKLTSILRMPGCQSYPSLKSQHIVCF